MTTYSLPMSGNIHIIDRGTSCIVLDVNNNIIFRTDSGFGAYLKGSKPEDSRCGNLFGSRLEALYQNGVFKDNANDSSTAYYNPVYKLSIEAFHGCNLDCAYCYGKAGGIYQNTGMHADFESLKQTMDYFVYDFGSEAKSYEINIVGAGEPLLNFSLVKKLKEHCKKLQEQAGKPVIFWVFTNGTVFNDDIIDFFMNEKQGLTISLDGPPEIHDALRPFCNGQGTHATIAQWIRKILERSKGRGGLENLWVSTVVTAKHTSIKDIVMHLRELGVRNAQIRPIKTLNPGLTLSQERMESLKFQYEELNGYLIGQAVNGDMEELKIILNDRDFWGRHVIRALGGYKIHYRCGAAKSKLCVLANGDIYPCDISADIYELRLGNVKDGIDREKTRAFYTQEVSRKAACQDCWCRYYCGGGCYVSAYVHNGDIGSPDKVKCELVKKLVELAIVFVHELQIRSPDNFARVCRYIEVQEKVMKRIYGL